MFSLHFRSSCLNFFLILYNASLGVQECIQMTSKVPNNHMHYFLLLDPFIICTLIWHWWVTLTLSCLPMYQFIISIDFFAVKNNCTVISFCKKLLPRSDRNEIHAWMWMFFLQLLWRPITYAFQHCRGPFVSSSPQAIKTVLMIRIKRHKMCQKGSFGAAASRRSM